MWECKFNLLRFDIALGLALPKGGQSYIFSTLQTLDTKHIFTFDL